MVRLSFARLRDLIRRLQEYAKRNKEGQKIYESISVVCQKFTSARVKYLGCIRYNPKIIRHIKPQVSSFWERLLHKPRESP